MATSLIDFRLYFLISDGQGLAVRWLQYRGR
jgi:hypothetical protein